MHNKQVAKKQMLTIGFLLLVMAAVKLVTFFPTWIENQYSRGIYTYIAVAYRLVLGRIPFSVGDILYFLVGLYLLVQLVRFIRYVRGSGFKQISRRQWLLNGFYIFCGIYLYFNLFWGLNYNRPGIASQLQLNPHGHSERDLKNITAALLLKVNATRVLLPPQVPQLPEKVLFSKARNCYQKLSHSFGYLRYNYISVKPSMYGTLGNYLGFLGYFNPITGEAQINTTQPAFLAPFVTCHEIGHQLGYASESEANFVGYLAASTCSDNVFKYSAYFEMYQYANRELFLRDSVAAQQNNAALDTLVKSDVAELRAYWKKSDNLVEPVIRLFYDKYLKANQQSNGIDSYNEVIGWLIAYSKKYKTI